MNTTRCMVVPAFSVGRLLSACAVFIVFRPLTVAPAGGHVYDVTGSAGVGRLEPSTAWSVPPPPHTYLNAGVEPVSVHAFEQDITQSCKPDESFESRFDVVVGAVTCKVIPVISPDVVEPSTLTSIARCIRSPGAMFVPASVSRLVAPAPGVDNCMCVAVSAPWVTFEPPEKFADAVSD